MMPIVSHRHCGMPMYLQAVAQVDDVRLVWVCPIHGPVPVISAAIYTGGPTDPIVYSAHDATASD
jgi:hypothetical protein